MEEIAHLLPTWIVSKYGLFHVLGWVILTASAIWCNRTRAVRRFLLAASLTWLSFALLAMSGSWQLSANEYAPIWSLAVVALYAFPLSVMIAGHMPTTALTLSSILLLAVQLPVSMFYPLVAYCYIGGDCV